MKTGILLLLVICFHSFAEGQTIHKEPFIIKGKITNCSEKFLQLHIRDTNFQLYTDTIPVDDEGDFSWKTYKVQTPQQTDIINRNFQINNILIAPGYELSVSGDGSNQKSFFISKRISGIGAESNRYQFIVDSIKFARGDVISWLDFNSNELLAYIKKDQGLRDSVAKAVFTRPSSKDKYLKYYESLVRLDNKFHQLSMLAVHVYWKGYSAGKSESFIRDNFDNKMLDNMYKDEYLVSGKYRDLLSNEWLEFLVNIDQSRDTSLKNQEGYLFKKIIETYSDKAREFTFYRKLEYEITFCKSLNALIDYHNYFERYKSILKSGTYKEDLANLLEEKKMDLLRMQAGKPAPSFAVESKEGKIFSLEDFRNKVIYLDLWASWCIPCRQEIPGLNLLYNKFKNDDRIAFISIAVLDEENRWRKALSEDKPGWLQLFDREGKVAKAYFANLVPQFILIDKQGNIVDFQAPWPSSGNVLESLLIRELSK